MPLEAKFCGICGSPLEGIINDQKALPVWHLFKPGAFITYRVDALNERYLYTYEVLQITDNIIEFLCIKSKNNEKTEEFTYIGKDRRHWAPKGWKGFMDESEAARFKNRYSFKELIPTERYTVLWINNNVKVGDKVRIGTFDRDVLTEVSENGRIFYIIGDKPGCETVFNLYYYYDARTGLYWKLRADNKILSELISVWTSL
ncbi:MAG: hypothetical protein QXO15_12320 [Nitrososphaerota archaeon]